MDQKIQKVLLVLTCIVFKLISFSPTFSIFPSNYQIIAFHMRQTISFWYIKKMFSASQLDSWLTKTCQMILVLSYFDIPICPSRKVHIWNFYRGLNRRSYIIYFQMFVKWNFQWFCPLHWNNCRLKMQKKSPIFLHLSILRPKNLWSYPFELFCRGVLRHVLSKLVL